MEIPYSKYAAVLLQTRCTPVHGPCTDRRGSFFLVLWAAARLRMYFTVRRMTRPTHSNELGSVRGRTTEVSGGMLCDMSLLFYNSTVYVIVRNRTQTVVDSVLVFYNSC